MSESEAKPDSKQLLREPPNGYFIVLPQPRDDEGALDLAGILSGLIASWRLLTALTIAGAALGLGVAVSMRNVYRADVLVTAVVQNGSGGLGGLRSQFGGLATLAGVDIPGGGGRKEESLATLSSPGLVREFIQARNLLPVLFAERWDAATGKWRSGTKVPTMEDAVKRFIDDVRIVSEDRRSGIITVTVEWFEPALAADWANGLVETANEKLRQQAVEKADRSQKYLLGVLEKTTVTDLRQGIYRLIEEQVNSAMLANVQPEYAFHVVDHAVAPDRKIRPKRAVLTVVAGAVGFVFAFVIIYVRRAQRARRERGRVVA